MAVWHDEVARLGIIERYLRHELSPEEEQEWEEHYFQCEQCFQALQQTAQIAQFVKNERRRRSFVPAATRGRPALTVVGRALGHWIAPTQGWRPVVAAAAAVIVVAIPAVIGWMRVTALQQQVEELQMPVGGLISYVLEEGIRGDEPSVAIPADAGRFVLQFNLLVRGAEPATYVARIHDMNGAVVWTGAGLEGQGPYGTFAIVCHSSFFAPADYALHVDEVRAEDGMVINSSIFPFRVAAPERQGAGR